MLSSDLSGSVSRDILGGALAPLGWFVGFIAAPHTAVRDQLVRWRRGLGAILAISGDLPVWSACVEALAPFEAPTTTELLVAHGEGWTCYLNNDINGGDSWPATSHIAGQLGVRWIIASHQPKTAVGHACTEFSLGGPDGDPAHLDYLRTVAAHAEDGRWRFFGAALPFEDTAAYDARHVRNRFTRPMLVRYLAATGVEVDDRAAYTDATLIRQIVTWRTRQQTLQQARAAWGIR